MGSHYTVNGLKLWVEDSGPETAKKGTVLLFHGFPDTSAMWRPQVQALNAAGYRTITPDLPGLGRSDKPSDLAAYNVQTSITPAMVALVDALKLDKFSVVGHDFGAGPAWGMAFMCPDRVERVVVLSVGYFGTYYTAQPLEQRKASWYIPFFLMPGSEEAIRGNDWALFRLWLQKQASKETLDASIARLSEPGALTAALNLYRSNFTVELFGNLTPVPPPFKLPMPVMGVHPQQDWACLEGQMKASEIAVEEGKFEFRQVPGGHWWFVQEPEALNKLLLEFLA